MRLEVAHVGFADHQGRERLEPDRRRGVEAVPEGVQPPLKVREDHERRGRRSRDRGSPKPPVQRRYQAERDEQRDANREHRRLERRRLDRRHADVVVENGQFVKIARHSGSVGVQVQPFAILGRLHLHAPQRELHGQGDQRRGRQGGSHRIARAAVTIHSPSQSRSPSDRMTRPYGVRPSVRRRRDRDTQSRRRPSASGCPARRRMIVCAPSIHPPSSASWNQAVTGPASAARRSGGIRCRRILARRRRARGMPPRRPAR